MKVEFNDAEHEIEKNTSLKEVVEKDTELKNIIVNYVGQKKSPENDEVTLEMVLEVVSEEFPGFVMPIAEENWIRGYQQALADVDEGQRLMEEQKEDNE